MRLTILEHGHRLPAKIFQRIVRAASRNEIDDVSKTAMHRPAFFGRPLYSLGGGVLRGPSFWTPGEREYMAAFVSRLNECPFCVRVHTEMTRVETHGALSPDSAASLRPQLAAMLPLLEELSRTPGEVSAHDIDVVRSAGVPDEGIVDALHVTLIFNTLNRLANAFDWAWTSDAHVRSAARALHAFRYRLPGLVLR